MSDYLERPKCAQSRALERRPSAREPRNRSPPGGQRAGDLLRGRLAGQTRTGCAPLAGNRLPKVEPAIKVKMAIERRFSQARGRR